MGELAARLGLVEQYLWFTLMRVLVVEDHVELAETVASVLRREGIAVDVAHNGTDALSRTAVIDYDVVVLDRDLPGVHGDQVCRTLVASKCRTRVLMLTASSTIADRVEGLLSNASSPTCSTTPWTTTFPMDESRSSREPKPVARSCRWLTPAR